MTFCTLSVLQKIRPLCARSQEYVEFVVIRVRCLVALHCIVFSGQYSNLTVVHLKLDCSPSFTRWQQKTSCLLLPSGEGRVVTLKQWAEIHGQGLLGFLGLSMCYYAWPRKLNPYIYKMFYNLTARRIYTVTQIQGRHPWLSAPFQYLTKCEILWPVTRMLQ